MLFLRIRRPLFVAAVFYSGLLWADQLILQNGDRVTGKIVKKDGDKVMLQSDLMGDLTIPWQAVSSVTSEEPLTVVLADGKSVVGRLNTTEGKVEVATATAVEKSPLGEVYAIRNAKEQMAYERHLHPGWLDLWAGYFDLSVAMARGNARTNTWTTAFNAERTTKTDKSIVYFNQIYASATVDQKSSATAEDVRGGWAYDRNIRSRVFYNTFQDYEFDRFQDLDLRFVFGGGLGFSALKREHFHLDLLGGANYERENFNTGPRRNSAEVYWGDDWSYKVSAKTSIRQSFRMFHNLTNTGEYRSNFDFGASTNFWKRLAWHVSASDHFLSDPAPGRRRNDILLTAGVRLSFTK